ncbi:benzoate 4-monooxygenase cytochrome P450 [Aspergillus minisclerotigenes]|uniref:Benzoate 4-monooxygenase cytochrome P450 n=1 Tax=Aspergillus minisclerotigenes TaxID=656917 RepID=A0A5N6IQZ1_9EURO|nr:benzoate 4-monooxygenase cytochrome P450 [Aspergillus minisclerotigenes]
MKKKRGNTKHLWQARYAKNHLVLEDLHVRYGDFVRTGPSEITVYHPDVFMAIDGPQSNCIKAEWYDLLYPKLALVNARDKNTHAARRRQWNRGFSPESLRQYEEKTLYYLDQLDTCLEDEARKGRISEITDLLYWFGFDTMGDFVFNKSFNMLHDKKWHHIIILLQRALSIMGPLSPIPWLVQIAFKLFPRVWILGDWFRMVDWCEDQMLERMQTKIPGRVPDVAHYIMQEAKPSQVNSSWLSGDTVLAIAAGSEPTAVALMGIFTELARHPVHAEKIYQETRGLDIRNPGMLATNCPHLEAVIRETLRLFPALLTGGYRKTLQGGTFVGGTYIPPTRPLSLHDTPYPATMRPTTGGDCFERATEFIPERWYSKPEMVRNKAAYAPWGTGHHSCLGRALATDILRLVTARVVGKYHLRLPPGETGDQVLGDLKDQFTSNPGRLRLKLELRQG